MLLLQSSAPTALHTEQTDHLASFTAGDAQGICLVDMNQRGGMNVVVESQHESKSSSPIASREGSVRDDSSVCSSRKKSLRNHEADHWPNRRKYNKRSLLLFTLESSFRKALIAAIEWPWWDRTVLFVILVNSCLLAYNQPYDIPELRPNDKERNAMALVSQIFSVFFTIECVVKIIALGFCWGKGTYLSDSWNYLDLFIVIIGLLDFFPSGGSMGNLSALRSLRVLRPLRAITKFPQLKFLVVLLLKCLPMLANVIGLLTFIFFIFGILGVQLFGGQLRGGCYDIDSGARVATQSGGPCSVLLGGDVLCRYEQECLLLAENPNNDMSSFDSILLAFISIFQIMTLSGWTDILYAVQGAYSRFMFAYFMFLIVIGPIFAVQLFLVVIAKTHADEKAETARTQIASSAPKNLSEIKTANKVHPTDSDAQAKEIAANEAIHSQSKVAESGELVTGFKEEQDANAVVALNPDSLPKVLKDPDLPKEPDSAKDVKAAQENGINGDVEPPGITKLEIQAPIEVTPRDSRRKLKRSKSSMPIAVFRKRLVFVAASAQLEHFILVIILVNTLIMGMDVNCDFCVDGFCAKYKGAMESTNIFFNSVFLVEFLIKITAFGPKRYLSVAMNWLDVVIVCVGMAEVGSVYETSYCLLRTVEHCKEFDECEGGGGISALRTFRLVRIVKLLRAFPDVQKQVAAIVATLSSVAALIALISIFLLIFCILGMNLMGGNLLVDWPGKLQRGSAVFVQIPGDILETTPFPVQGRRATITDYSANRTSRPWKVCIMYGNELPGRIGGILDNDGCTWADAKDTAGLHTPAIVGVMERDHYDDLGHAFISIFGVLTGSNWNNQAYNITYRMGKGIFVFYMAWIVLGNWMLLNLFIAILIQGFAEEKEKKRESQRLQFARKVVEKLGASSPGELSKQMYELFQKIDQDGSGHIDAAEMETLLREFGVEIEPKDLLVLFAKYDADGSGQIDFGEFFKMIQELIERARADMAEELAASDTDNLAGKADGSTEDTQGRSRSNSVIVMSQADLRRAAEEADRLYREAEEKRAEARKRIAKQRIKFAQKIMAKLGGSSEQVAYDLAQKMFELFQEVDKDNSGQIDIEEMESLLVKCEVEMDSKDLATLFNKYDDDGSGQISFKEFFMMIKELLDTANDYLKAEGVQDQAAQSPEGSSASPVRMLFTQEMDDAYLEAEKLALAAEKYRRDSRAQFVEPQIEGGEVGDSDADKDAVLSPAPRIPRSMGFMHVNHPIRRAIKAFIDYPPNRQENKWFDNLVLLGILTSSALLALDNPNLGDNSPARINMENVGLALNGLFIVECSTKALVLSLSSYLRSGWNKLDFLIVSTSCLDMGLTYGLQGQKVDLAALKIFRMLRILRALRPLRIIARAKGLKILVTTLMSAAKPITNTVGIALVVFSIYGILGMQFLLGRMGSCSDSVVWHKEECVGVDSAGVPLIWQTHPVNFDNLYRAIVAMFILATQDDWQGHMWAGIDSTSKLTGPVENNNPMYALFYLGAIVVAGYLVINIFVGVFVDSYNVAAEKMGRDENTKPEPPAKLAPLDEDDDEGLRGKVGEVVTNTNFDLFIAFFIVTNVFTMAFESFKQAKWQAEFGLAANFFYSLIFGWECAFKVFAFHPQRYYQGGWNKFDFFIVMVTFGGVVIDSLGDAVNLDPTILRVLRIFRVFRILRAFRIFKAAKGLQAIVTTLFRSLPALANLFAMLGLFFFVFAVLGVTLFGTLCAMDDPLQPGIRGLRCSLTDPAGLLNPLATFRDVPSAFVTLFRCATGDGWGDLLYTCSAVATGRGPIPSSLWNEFLQLNGSAPPLEARASITAIDFTRIAISNWNSTVLEIGGGKYPDPALSPDWPTPSPVAAGWLALARAALPVCVTDEEAFALQESGHLDCSVGPYIRDCSGTCGDSVIPTLYFFFFCVAASFILLQLVIAVLMEQLGGASDAAELERRTPGCMRLRLFVFNRMCRRWRFRALRKLSYIAHRRHIAKRQAAAEACLAAAPASLPAYRDD